MTWLTARQLINRILNSDGVPRFVLREEPFTFSNGEPAIRVKRANKRRSSLPVVAELPRDPYFHDARLHYSAEDLEQWLAWLAANLLRSGNA